MPFAIKDNQIQEVNDKDVDVELMTPNAFFGSHINLIPLQSAVQGPRLFYGARFMNQAMPLEKPEAPYVQNLIDGDLDGRSFDELFGRQAGAVFADDDGEVTGVDDDSILFKNPLGEERRVDLYNSFPFNRKTRLHNTAGVKVGDKFTKGQLLARSNYTDEKGTLAMGVNARVGLLPFKGYSMDDAIVVSQAFANRLKSEHSYTQTQDFDQDVKPGLKHYISLFPDKFKKIQLENLDEKGVVKPGTVLQEGDPLILATKPKVISSTSAQLGKLSKMMRQARADAAQTWDHHEPGMVTDVAHTKNGVKLVIRSLAPAQQGDKIVFRSGQKGVISKILPDEHMPRTMEGQPLEVLLNPLGIPSRANNSIIYELLLGKAAQKLGKAIKLPGFNNPKESWFDMVQDYLQQAGVKDTEELWDPTTNKRIENPVTVGNGYVLKLHHTSESKASARGQGGYSLDQQPLQGGGEGAQAKRFSGLEIHSMLSAGAYKTLREGSTLRGQKNDEYWRQLRMGYSPREPGAPFVWDKFQALLMGAGMFARNIGGGKLRLGPMTDDELEKRQAIEIKNGKLVNLATPDLAPFAGGLFDHAIVGNNRWGKIPLPEAMPNPAFEKAIMQLLGLTQKEMRAIIAGEMELPDHLR